MKQISDNLKSMNKNWVDESDRGCVTTFWKFSFFVCVFLNCAAIYEVR